MITVKGQPAPLFSYKLVNEHFAVSAGEKLGSAWHVKLGDMYSADAAVAIASFPPNERADDLPLVFVREEGVVSQLSRPADTGYEHLDPVVVATLTEPVDLELVLRRLAGFNSDRSHVSKTNTGFRVTQAGFPRDRPAVFDLRGPISVAVKEWLVIQKFQLDSDEELDLEVESVRAHGISFRDLEQTRRTIRGSGVADDGPAWFARMIELQELVKSRS